MKLFIVQGFFEESNRKEQWIVCTYPFKEQAEQHSIRANSQVDKEYERFMLDKGKLNFKYKNPYDKVYEDTFNHTFRGFPQYYILEVEFYEGLDAYIDAKGI